jgi:hypothetical protein
MNMNRITVSSRRHADYLTTPGSVRSHGLIFSPMRSVRQHNAGDSKSDVEMDVTPYEGRGYKTPATRLPPPYEIVPSSEGSEDSEASVLPLRPCSSLTFLRFRIFYG